MFNTQGNQNLFTVLRLSGLTLLRCRIIVIRRSRFVRDHRACWLDQSSIHSLWYTILLGWAWHCQLKYNSFLLQIVLKRRWQILAAIVRPQSSSRSASSVGSCEVYSVINKCDKILCPSNRLCLHWLVRTRHYAPAVVYASTESLLLWKTVPAKHYSQNDSLVIFSVSIPCTSSY